MHLCFHLGKEATEYYLREGQKELKERGENVPYELTYLTGNLMEDYLHDQSVVREFASLKRGNVKSRYTVSHFKSEMKGIYSSCIGKETLDEAPFAYRRIAEIQSAIRETVETGVRLIHIPTGITVTATTQRSQYANKREAMNKLNAILQQKELEETARQTKFAWREHTRIIRGNPVRVYEGLDFKLKRKNCCKSEVELV